ncbi:MAG: hypothetical protein ACTSRB_01265 [Candidatus Helarchaeota archaeon]
MENKMIEHNGIEERIKELKLQYKCAIVLILTGVIIIIFAWYSFLVLSGLILFCGGAIIIGIYLENRWIKPEYLKYGLIATTSFAIIYGILEYIFFDATWNDWFKISALFPNKYFYWIFMTILNISIVLLASRGSGALAMISVPLFSVNEDLLYWITKSFHEIHWVFPVKNWFDEKFPFLQGLGNPIPFFPFFPRFYLVGWILCSILIVMQFKNLEGKNFLICFGIFIGASIFCGLILPL